MSQEKYDFEIFQGPAHATGGALRTKVKGWLESIQETYNIHIVKTKEKLIHDKAVCDIVIIVYYTYSKKR